MTSNNTRHRIDLLLLALMQHGWLLAVALVCSFGNASADPKPEPAPYAIAVVYSGWEIWIGNEDHIPADDPTRRKGALKPIKAAFVKVDLAKKTPKAIGALYTYAEKVVIRVPMGPITQLTGNAFGPQKDYFGATGVELVAGVRLGLAELARVSAKKKYLLVLGDGTDTNPETAPKQLEKLRSPDVEVIAIVYKADLSAETTVLSSLTANVKTITTFDQLTKELVKVLGGLK